jgi:hypothetical protein
MAQLPGFPMRATALAAAAVLLLAGPALAQGPISTAPTAGPASPQPTDAAPPIPTTPRPSLYDVSAGEAPIALGPCGPEKVKPDGSLETKAHGEVEASVGTGGFRQIAGAVCQPLGQHGAVSVSVSQTQDNGRYYRRH